MIEGAGRREGKGRSREGKKKEKSSSFLIINQDTNLPVSTCGHWQSEGGSTGEGGEGGEGGKGRAGGEEQVWPSLGKVEKIWKK